jgi:hypothetical protein
MTDFLQTLDERSDGIGAADGTRIVMSVKGRTGDGRYLPDQRFGAQVGYAYVHARREANWQRKRAFDRIPAYAVLEPAGNHTFGATKAELRLGCPAWPKDQCCDAHPDGWGRCEPSR